MISAQVYVCDDTFQSLECSKFRIKDSFGIEFIITVQVNDYSGFEVS